MKHPISASPRVGNKGNESRASVPPASECSPLRLNLRPSCCLFRISAALGVCFTIAAQLTTDAADILRGGGFTAPTQGSAQGGTPAASTAQARANARDALARTSNAVQSVRAMQAAARNIAIKGPNNLGLNPNQPGVRLPNVPNGLVTGGLKVAPGVPIDLAHPIASENAALWQGAKLPVQITTTSGRTKVTIEQTKSQALLNWETFNIGKETTLTFDQSAGGDNKSQWIAFNKINDPTGVPSQILGSIQAPGQVYIINQNGIIFGGSSQINLHTLVASSLPINDNLIGRGLLNNPDVQFLFSSLPLSAGPKGTPAFTPPPAPNGFSGDVTVQPGAKIESPSSAEHVGGRVALIAPNVTNGGTISTPDGQTILAAGQQVGFNAHATTDPHLRGLDVYVGQGGGTVINTAEGLINAPRADVTMTGKDVRQLGAIESSTSVSLNGRIDLLADYNAVGNPKFDPNDPATLPFLFKATGTVTLGPGSVTLILPEYGSTETAIGTELALRSQANLRGQAIHFGADAQLLAPNADVTVSAGTWKFIPGESPLSPFVYSTGQIYLDPGASINVAGSVDVSVPVSQNIVSVQLLGTELSDSPLQRFGVFRGSTIQIDLRQVGIYNGRAWAGTPLADTSGYIGLIQRSVGELTTAGGTVTLSAGGSVVIRDTATVDVSGGWIDYVGGMVQTSRVVSGGHIFDISQATPDRIYEGFNTGTFTTAHLKWNVLETFTTPLLGDGAHFEESYVLGGNGGKVSITAPAVALDGSLLGHTVTGPRQRVIAPIASTLSIAFQKQDDTVLTFPVFSPTPPRVVFQSDSNQAPADPFALDASGNPLALRADRVANVILSPDLLTEDGFGILKIDNSDGLIKVPKNVTLSAAAGGSISLLGANIDIQGHVFAPGGSLSFVAFDFSPFSLAVDTPAPDPTRGHFTLGVDGVLGTAGLIVDDRPIADAPASLPLIYNGGSITINSYNADLREGSVVDVSAGLTLNAAGKKTYGDGGKIAIIASVDPLRDKLIGGDLRLDATLLGYAGGRGGSLTIQAPAIQIGGRTTNSDTLLLSPDFFSQGGFNSFALTGIGMQADQNQYVPGVLIAPGTVIAPVVQSLVADIDPNGGNEITLTTTVLPQGLRNPVNLSFNAKGARNDANLVTVRGDFVMGAGAVIRTDPRAVVSASGDTATVLGSIIAPGGSISITGGKDSSALFDTADHALTTVDLGPRSFLSTAGTTLLIPDPRGYHTGIVLSGGAITVSGNIVAEAGSRLDVSGASDTLDFLPAYSAQNALLDSSVSISALVPTRVDSNGGVITLTGQQELFSDATLIGAAGGSSAGGGSLIVSSGRFYPPNDSTPRSPLDITLQVTQNGPVIPVPFHAPGETAIGKTVLAADGTAASSLGHFAANDFNRGGFDSLTLKGTVQFSGPVSINANRSISVASSGVLFADSAVTLEAPYVALGQAFLPPVQPALQVSPFTLGGQPLFVPPTNGSGQLTVIASLIDIGTLTLQGIGKANFIADNGDIRGNGTLDVAGAIYMRAGQVYPTTAGKFNIIASDYQKNGATQAGSVTFAASGTRPLAYSAGGQLNVYGSIINQGGVLRAPLGTINLGWDGTGTGPIDPITGLAVAPTQQLTLSRGSVTSVSAIDPISGEPIIIPYGLNLNGTSWIDPMGVDITVGGAPGKTINLSAAKIADQAGSVVDIRGGGDLYSYRWVKGVGGSSDILASSSGFAIIPGYDADYAPYAPFTNDRPTNSDVARNLGSDPGYVDGRLSIGDRVYLNASDGLAAGTYTLLPARYALLPGAFLVTPQSGVPLASVALPDGSSLVSGYRYNDLSAARTGTPLAARFEVASGSVVRNRAEYDDSLANIFLRQSALDHNLVPPRLPIDSGQLVLAATQAMAVQGTVASRSVAGGRGGLVDISSPVDILIAGPGVIGDPGTLVLDSTQLSAIGAESLLIGGVRQLGANGTTVVVKTGDLTVDNHGAPLSGPDVILVANNTLTLAAGAEIKQTGQLSGAADTLLLGKASVAGSGDGTLLRVTSDPGAQIVRSGVSSSTVPTMTIGAGARIAGASLTLDSTSATNLDPTARLDGQAISLNSGQISLQLDNPGTPQPTFGLVLSGGALQSLQAGAKAVSLLSYSSIDIYGTGQVGNASIASLALHAAEIRGFNNGGGTVTFSAQNILLDNSANRNAPGPLGGALQGTLAFDAGTIRLGANALAVDQYANLVLNASNGIVAQRAGGLTAQGALAITTPLITGAAGAAQTITAGGALTVDAPAGEADSTIVGGLGASVTLAGASVAVNTDIVLPSGTLTLHATNGDVLVGNLAASRLDVGGTAQHFFDLVKYTDGGQIALNSDHGSVNVATGSIVTVAAQSEGGSAGSLSVDAREGSFTVADGTMRGAGGAGGRAGSFSLDAGSLPSLQALNAALDTAALVQSRTIRVRNGDVLVDGESHAHHFDLSVDKGSITVTGTIDASGTQGGSIDLVAGGSVTLASGSLLTVASDKFSHAGKGGSIVLEAGGETNGSFSSSAVVDIQAGSTLDLSVAENTTASAAAGNFTGTLHLRAPQTSASTDLQIAAINGSILNASSIVAEGWQLFDLTSSGGAITSVVQNAVKANVMTFGGNAATITNRLLAGNAGLASVLSVQAGAEIINRTGDLTLGTLTSTSLSDWDLSTYRSGPNNAPGVLTLRAAGNLVFYNALSDGFTSSDYTAQLLDRNPLLPANVQSWSYHLAAGADFSAADFHRVQPLSVLGAGSGSLQLGKNGGANIASGPGRPPGPNAQTSDAVAGHYQVIRTGSGDIDIAAGRNVQLLNQFATIYTAGVKVTDPTLNGTFDLPVLKIPSQSGLGAIQQSPFYPAQYSFGGGDVTITAQADIIHQTRNSAGNLIDDSERELPMNWLYRRGYLDPITGQFGVVKNGDVGSTTWWIDFSNFFEGVGALGGGNVTMIAGHDVKNVDGLVPTNARMPKGTPDASKMVELGGGDLVVRAGHNIDGGVYYVERGHGTLSAGNEITTNSTRSPSLTIISVPSVVLPSQTWLPTTLFVGKGSFDVSARGDLLLGPVVNPFLLPEGINNTFWYKSYFSTYGTSNAINVSSLQGNVTFREAITFPDGSSSPVLEAWLKKELFFTLSGGQTSAAFYQPWLRLNETSMEPFASSANAFDGVVALMPATLRATSFSGNINVTGNLALSPSPTGTLDLAAAGSINGLQINGVQNTGSGSTFAWAPGSINLSDADPNAVPGIASPLSLSVPFPTGTGVGGWLTTNDRVLDSINLLFNESGSSSGQFGVIQTKQALHAAGILHANDPDPVHLYSRSGNISDFTLFSGKAARVIAGNDITAIGLYVQNTSATDTSVISAGRDIIAYDVNSPLRVAAQASGNTLNGDIPPTGDIQISGPGTLEVLAGRNLDLGVGPNNPDGTGVGLTSIGNFRNPALPFAGADIIAGAGIGDSTSLDQSKLDFEAFIDQFLAPGTIDATRYLPELGTLLSMTGTSEAQVWDAFKKLPEERQDSLALSIFYLVLRDAGRDHNLPGSPGFGTYTAGFTAISALFPGDDWQGDISLTSREIKTRSGGNINLFAPGGGLTVGLDVTSNQAADQGILTEHGGGISIFTDQSVAVGTSRIFTLRGGNELIWSSRGDIAAGASSKTVQSAPPTRVVIDPQSADVATDLAGLATGGGIGVLATIVGVPPGDVDLIAPGGTIDAGDAGIRVSGNINIAAVQVLNSSNIQTGGGTSGVPSAPPSSSSISSLSPSNATAANNQASNDAARQQARTQEPPQDVPSIISVEVLGYGGGEGEEDEEEKRRKAQAAPAQASLPVAGAPAYATAWPSR